MSGIRCADYKFSVKKTGNGTPFIAFDPVHGNLAILGEGGLVFNLPFGTSVVCVAKKK